MTKRVVDHGSQRTNPPPLRRNFVVIAVRCDDPTQSLPDDGKEPDSHCDVLQSPFSSPPPPLLFLSFRPPFPFPLNAVSGPHARTRVGRGCRPHELEVKKKKRHRSACAIRLSGARQWPSGRGYHRIVPGPLTLRMMLRVWSSMNSTRTWVTPPREPIFEGGKRSNRSA